MIDPPAAAFSFQPAPGCASGRDRRRSRGEGFRDGQAEVFVQSREDEKISVPVRGGFCIAVDRDPRWKRG